MKTNVHRAPEYSSAIRTTALWPWLATIALIAVTVLILRWQGRIWWCKCGQFFLWSGDIWSTHNSQHLVDPYSFSHMQHGVLFFGLLWWLCPRLSVAWRFFLATAIEVLWEISENTQAMIERYRTTTISLDYFGDSIGNSMGDILSFAAGFWIARRVGLWPSVAILAITEIVMIILYRDSLSLNILMLIYPIEAVKQWQTPA